MRMLFPLTVTLGVVVLAHGALSAQPALDDGDGPVVEAAPPGEPVRVRVPPVSTEVNGHFSVPILVEGDQPFFHLELHVENSIDDIRLTGWHAGAALSAHIAEHGGPPECDIIIFPDGGGLMSIMLLSAPFEVARHGSEWLIFDYEVTATTPRETTITVVHPDSPEPVEGRVEIRGGPEVTFVRGDVDDDSICNLTDAISILGFLFLSSAPEPVCSDAADVDDDGSIAITDAVGLLNILFLSSAPLDETCRGDATADALPSCETSRCAAAAP